jgi:hypothetical protein
MAAQPAVSRRQAAFRPGWPLSPVASLMASADAAAVATSRG